MADNNSKAMWKSYMQATAGFAEFKRDDSSVFFLASAVTPGIPGGTGMPQAIMNEAIYAAADSVLKEDTVWYNPSESTSYVTELGAYLDRVAPKGSVNEDIKYAYINALEQADTARTDYLDSVKAAKKARSRQSGFDPSDGSFNSWAQQNFPQLEKTRRDMESANSVLASILLQRDGPRGDALDKQKQKVRDAQGMGRNNNGEIPGITMAAKEGTMDDLKKYIESVKNGEAIQTPSADQDYLKPAYELDPSYSPAMDQWIKNYDQTGFAKTTEVSASNGSRISFKAFGHTAAKAENSVGRLGWLRVKEDKDEPWSDKHNVVSDSSSKCTFTAKDAKLFSVRAGKWNMPRYRRDYPDTFDLPESAKGLLQITHLLCASGVKYTMKLEGSTKQDFDEKFNDAKGRGGVVSIFGLNMSADRENKNPGDTHTLSYDTSTGEFSAEPNSTLGTCVLLGAVGKK